MRLTQPILAIAPDATVVGAVNLMVERNVGAVVVMDRGKVLGMFTERDLMRRVVHRGSDPEKTSITEVMTSPVRSVADDTPMEKAVQTMRDEHIRHLLVVDGEGAAKGMLALRYVLYDLIDDLERKVDDLEGVLMEDSRGG